MRAELRTRILVSYAGIVMLCFCGFLFFAGLTATATIKFVPGHPTLK